MRAKFVIDTVTLGQGQEVLSMRAVTNGTPEDNTFSRWTPSASLAMTVTNPNLFGKYKPGDKLYVDFSAAP